MRRAAGPRADTPAQFPLAGRRGIRLRPVLIACDSAVRHANDQRFRGALLGQRRQAVEGDGTGRSRWATDDVQPDRSFAGLGDHSVDHRRSSRSDNGAGIPSENLGTVFDPFFTTGRDQGGLGLHIVFSLVATSVQGQIEIARTAGGSRHHPRSSHDADARRSVPARDPGQIGWASQPNPGEPQTH
ncbi:ATP-binding protein [Methylobacterium sp. Leaf112]|uniref:ATP-binding protein n=1 Tax=Methylobacterium sp. Leaf112 TaxID=1736258 RepID=UPI0023784600|nr:ATP-binding protein [Methylobacterium sp. Leaf112]